MMALRTHADARHTVGYWLRPSQIIEGLLQVLLDCGGKEGPVDSRLLAALAVLTPNETELARLTGHLPLSPAFHKHCYSQALS